MSSEPSTGKTRSKKGKGTRKVAPPAAPFAAPPIPADVVKKPVALLKLACKLSMSNGSFIDTKFYAYTRRTASGGVCAPRAVFANSFVLRAKAPQYFGPCKLTCEIEILRAERTTSATRRFRGRRLYWPLERAVPP